jgi:hypothetical protein
MKEHPLSGRKQSPEHIRRRVEAVAKKRAAWTEEQKAAFAEKIRKANDRRSPEQKERFKYCNVGREPWCKGKKIPQISGKNHWNYGNNMPQESIEKIRLSLTGKKQSPELIRKRFAARAGYRHTPESKAKIGMANRGENNGMWEGGVSREEYPAGFWQKNFRESIRERDSRKCRICEGEENGKGHDIHHIDYNKRNIDPLNLVALCHKCHGKTNYNREGWIKFFSAGVIEATG